jgi:N-acetylneuraminate synthase
MPTEPGPRFGLVEIAGRKIGPGQPPYVICELSGNHNGSLDRALALLDAAALTGADAIKLQTYTPDTITLDMDGRDFRLEGGPWHGQRLYDLYGRAQTPYAWHAALFERAKAHGVTLFSTPFDQTAIDLLEGLNVPAYKIASFELVDLPLIAAVARCGKPILMSTGMANLAEIGAAVQTARAHGSGEIVLLHCTSAYPAPLDEANIRTIPDLAERFGVVAGLSDHTPGTAASVAAVALGACVIEKHFTLARTDGGPDAAFSLEPHEFCALVADCKAAGQALGQVQYDLTGSEAGNIQFRRSLYVVADLARGEMITPDHVRSIRPGFGLAPRHLDAVLGRLAKRDLTRGEPFDWDMI